MQKPKRHKTYKEKMRRINISVNSGLLKMVDEAAKKDFTTRSDIIRSALLWYLRPQGRDLAHIDPDEILETLQHRKATADLEKMMKDRGMI